MNSMAVSVDGKPYIAADHICYLDCMLSDVPNFAFVTGYFQASWTLKADLIASYVCRIINKLNEMGPTAIACARADDTVKVDESAWREIPRDANGELLREGMGMNGGFNNGPCYSLRTRHLQPRRGTKAPWMPLMSYLEDRQMLQSRPTEDE